MIKKGTNLKKKFLMFLIFKNKGEILRFSENGLTHSIHPSKKNHKHSGKNILYPKTK